MTTPTDDVEPDLRRRLQDLAATAPRLDPDWRERRGSQRVTPFALATAGLGVVVLGAAVLSTVLLTDDDIGGDPEADCARELTYDGATYTPVPGTLRMPIAGKTLPGVARTGGCDDGNGRSDPTDLTVQAVPGVGSVAVIVSGDLWIRFGSELPPALSDVRADPTCETSSVPLSLEGTVTSLEPTQAPRFDGDIRAPYALELRTDDPRLVQDRFAWVIVRAKGRAGSEPDAETVRRALWNGEPATVIVTCDGDRFEVLSVSSP